jgi:hypothetical protein
MTSNEMYFDFLFIVDILLLSEKMYSFVKDAKDHLKSRKDMVEISIQLAETIEFDNRLEHILDMRRFIFKVNEWIEKLETNPHPH